MKGWTFYYKSADCSGQAYAYAVLTNMAFTDGVTVFKSTGPGETFAAQSAKISTATGCETLPATQRLMLPVVTVGPAGADAVPPYTIQ